MAEPEPVFDDLQRVWVAWWEIGAGRSVGMAMGGLTWSDMSRWCEDNLIHGEERLRWCRLFRAMDGVAMAHWNRKRS